MSRFFFTFSLGLVLFFISPFLILTAHLQSLELPELDELLWALKNSLLQSFASLCICVFLSYYLIEGIFYFRRKLQNRFLHKSLELMIFLPSFLPALFTLLVFFSMIEPFPRGIIGMSLIHGMTFAGLFASLVVTIFADKAKGLIEISSLLGVGKLRIYFELLRMLRRDLFSAMALIFSIFFTSFSIPIAVGGGRGTTIEILIYEKMRISGDWSQALILSLLQSILIGLFTLSFTKKISTQMSQNSQYFALGSLFSALLTLLYGGFFLGGFLYYSLNGWEQVFAIENLWQDVQLVLPETFLLAVLAGLLMLLFLLLSTIALFQDFLRRFFIGFIAPSISLVGLSVILLKPAHRATELMFFLLATVIIFFAGLFKMGFEQSLMKLKNQVEVATLLGAPHFAIFKSIVLPQVLPRALHLAGIAGFWTAGDFAICKVIFTQDFLLAQLIEDLMATYRIEAATSLMALLMIIGVLVYSLFAGAAYVIGHQSQKKI